MRTCPDCHRLVPKGTRFCGHCGAPAIFDRDDPAGHHVLSFAATAGPDEAGPRGEPQVKARAEHGPYTRRRGAPAPERARSPEHTPSLCAATDGHSPVSPTPNVNRDCSYEPRVLVVLLPLFIVMAMMVPGALYPWTAIMNEVVSRAIIVSVQYVLLCSRFTQWTLPLVVAVQVVTSLGPHQPSPDHPALFSANLLLTRAGLQAVGLAVWRAWRLASPQVWPVADSGRSPRRTARSILKSPCPLPNDPRPTREAGVMPNAGCDPSRHRPQPDWGITDPSHGQPTLSNPGGHHGGRLISFAQAVRLRAARLRGQAQFRPDDHAAAEHRSRPVDESEDEARKRPRIAAATRPTGPKSDPSTPPGGLREWDPLQWVALVLIVTVIFLRPSAGLAGDANVWLEVVSTALLVTVQYALPLRPCTGRTLTLLTASTIVILFDHQRLGRDHLIFFCVDLALFAASGQAVALGLWRFRQQRREQAAHEGEHPVSDYRPTRIEEPLEVWRMLLPDGRTARATIVPQGASVELVWFINDRLEGGRSVADWATAVRRAADVRQWLLADFRARQ